MTGRASAQLALDDLALHDLQLLLLGVEIPLDVLGGRLLVGGSLTLADASVALDDSSTVEVGGRLLLTDTEGAPVAELLVAGISARLRGSRDGRVARGEVKPAGEPRWPDFAGLRSSPHPVHPRDDAAGGAGRPVALIAARPLKLAEVERVAALRSTGQQVLVLVPAVTRSPDAVPYPLLLRQALRLLEPLGARIVAVPIAWRDRATDESIASATGRAYGAGTTELLGTDDPGWRAVLASLDEESALADYAVVDPQTWRELRRWRPPPHERGLVVMLTGLSGSGKSTLALALAEHVRGNCERTVTLLDGDVTRRLLSSGLGFDRASRETNVRRLGWVASEIARHGGLAVVAAIAPYATTRAEVRDMARQHGDFVLVHVATPLAECERRDRKGLYARARRGELPGMTGIDHPYEAPEDADLVIDTARMPIDEALLVLLDHLRSHRWLRESMPGGAS